MLTASVNSCEWLLETTLGNWYKVETSPKAKLCYVLATLDVIWILTGTFFYFFMPNFDVGNLNLARALYFSANVGLGIGFSNVNVHHAAAKVFTSLYVLVGTAIVVGSLVVFANYVVHDEADRAYDEKREKEGNHPGESPLRAAYEAVRHAMGFTPKEIFLLCLWWGWFLIGFIWFITTQDSHFAEALYFVSTVFNTSGMVNCKDDNWSLLVAALYIIVAIPINVITWGEITGNISARFMEQKEKEMLELNSETTPLTGPGVADWASFLEKELAEHNLVTPSTIEILRQRFEASQH